MAGLSKQRGAWIATWYDDQGGKRAKRFTEREAAVAWMAEAGLEYVPRVSGNGPRSRAQVIDHLASHFEVSESGCWLWTGTLTASGYARMDWQPGDHVIARAHRVILAAIGQPVPQDRVVDHLCRVRHCINPDHLEVVTHRENTMRGIGIAPANAAKTHCPQGHPYSPENTYAYYATKSPGSTVRQCKTCAREYKQRVADQRVAS